MTTRSLPLAPAGGLLLALLLLASWPSGAQQAPSHPVRPIGAKSVISPRDQLSFPRAATSKTAAGATIPEFRKDSLFVNPSFEGASPDYWSIYDPGLIDWSFCSTGPNILPWDGFGSNMAPADGQSYIGLLAFYGNNAYFGQNLRVPLKAGVTYRFLIDVAYAPKYLPWDNLNPEVPITLQVKGSTEACTSTQFIDTGVAPGTRLWSKVVPMNRTTWQTDTVTFTPTTNISRLVFEASVSIPTGDYDLYPLGAVLLDNLRTLTGLALQKADGTAQADGKPFRLLWQPILTAGGLDSLAPRPQLRGTVRTFGGGRAPLPPALQVTDARGFYFLQEAAPAAGQDTTYYGLYVRNTPLPNGTKDDTLRHLYQCRRTFGSQAGLLGGALAPLTFGSPPASRPSRAAPSLAAPDIRAGHLPTAPGQRPDPLAEPQPRRWALRQRAR
ncbi:hypothetical protein IC235_21435 [Hymenobacter sp. BT664]|uniref:Uncharacterized protein n=1 Tax=Hymenobacter montanus TaxID=2771359 RepID=A0A927GLS0_9BACT|nr:hypothetical protein [Hymenobacter montanus]MBD2770456.1 hypothetical protein [Hymenobacter montanus]